MKVLTTGTKIRHFNKSVTDRSTRSSYIHTYISLSLCKELYLIHNVTINKKLILFLGKIHSILFDFESLHYLTQLRNLTSLHQRKLH